MHLLFEFLLNLLRVLVKQVHLSFEGSLTQLLQFYGVLDIVANGDLTSNIKF